MDMGVMFAQNEQFEFKFKGVDKVNADMKRAHDSAIEKLEERIDTLRIRVEQEKTKTTTPTSTQPANVQNFLASKLDDVFQSNKFKKLENLEPLMNDKFEQFENKINE